MAGQLPCRQYGIRVTNGNQDMENDLCRRWLSLEVLGDVATHGLSQRGLKTLLDMIVSKP